MFFFFFQAEDGIRDLTVTGVQTCALPISFGRNGAIGRNECVAEKKDAWIFEGRITSPTSVYEHRATYTKLDAETFTIRVERKEDAAYTQSGTYIYNRKKQ